MLKMDTIKDIKDLRDKIEPTKKELFIYDKKVELEVQEGGTKNECEEDHEPKKAIDGDSDTYFALKPE